MTLNLAEKISWKAVGFAPLAAPAGACPLLFLQESPTASLAFQFLWWTILIAYLVMAIIVIPVFLVTKKRVMWSPIRVIAFGGVVAILPVVIAFGFSSFEDIANRDWTLFWSLFGAGIAVATAYVSIQYFTMRDCH
jgi:hypothetical protein